MASLQQQLAEVQAAITACLASQRYGVEGRSQELPNLEALSRREEAILNRIQESEGWGGMGRPAQVDPPN